MHEKKSAEYTGAQDDTKYAALQARALRAEVDSTTLETAAQKIDDALQAIINGLTDGREKDALIAR